MTEPQDEIEAAAVAAASAITDAIRSLAGQVIGWNPRSHSTNWLDSVTATMGQLVDVLNRLRDPSDVEWVETFDGHRWPLVHDPHPPVDEGEEQ